MPVHRLASEDIRWIVAELRDLPKQSKKFADVPDDPVYVGAYLAAMHRERQLDGVVDREARSFLLFTSIQPWYACRVEVHELILWVPARMRGARTALDLINAFVIAAKEYSPHSIHAGATLDIVDKDRVFKLYEHRGFKRDGDGVSIRL